jgi:undecaprenyl-diphosphatase
MLLSNIIKAIVLGVVQGITEWLPISSTGHLILFDEFLKLNEPKEFMDLFNVVIQLGSILAVVVIFFHKMNPLSSNKTKAEKEDTWKLWEKVVIAMIPSVVIGLFLNDWLEEHLQKIFPVAVTLIFYGVAFIVIERLHKGKQSKFANLNSLTMQTVLIIGCFQVLALIPGTSRSGATILGAIIFGCSRYVAMEFSFFLAVPTMFGASGLKIFKFILKENTFTNEQVLILGIGSLIAFLISIIAIKFLLKFIQTRDFEPFGWYRIGLGIVLLAYLFFI